MRRDGLSEAAAGLPEESPPPLAKIDRYSRCAYSLFIISSRPGQAESSHHLGWEWLSPHASFDESTPVQPFRRKLCLVGAAYSPHSLRQCYALNTKVFSSAPFSHVESQAAPRKKARTSHMQGNLHVWFWPGTPVYCTNMCRSL